LAVFVESSDLLFILNRLYLIIPLISSPAIFRTSAVSINYGPYFIQRIRFRMRKKIMIPVMTVKTIPAPNAI
jgi:hypothetical protein